MRWSKSYARYSRTFVLGRGEGRDHLARRRSACLEIQLAEVTGQMLPELVSVLRPEIAAPEAVGVPYVVFPGNVGDDNASAHAIRVLRGAWQ